MFSAGQTWTVAHKNFATVLQTVAQVIGEEQYVPSAATLGDQWGREEGEGFLFVLGFGFVASVSLL